MRIAHDHHQAAPPPEALPAATVTEAAPQATIQAELQAVPSVDEHGYAVRRGIDWYAAYKRASIEATADTGQHHLSADSTSSAATLTTAASDATTTSEPAPRTPPPRAKTILEMSDAELQALPNERKRALLASLGVSDKHLRKTTGAKLDAAFRQVVQAMKSPGSHTLTLKLDKKYDLKLKVDQDGHILDAQAKQKKGFFAKLGGVLKLAAPILGIVLAPLTGGLSLVISSALGAIDAAKNKNWLGMVASVAGAFVPGTGSFLSSAVGAAGKTAALAGQTVARVASAVQQGAYAALAALLALRAKSPGALLGAIAGGVGAVAGGMGQAGERLARMGERLQTWSRVVGGGEAVLRAVRTKDYVGAAAGALGTAAGLTKGEVSQNLARYSGWVSSANSVQWGLRTRNYMAAAQGGLGLARDLRQPLAGLEPNKHDRVGERLDQAVRLVQGASYLQGAVKRKDAAGIAQAGLVLGGAAASISGRYVAEGGVGSSKDSKSQLGEGLYRAARMVGWADQAARAAKSKDYAGAAAASLGLAAEASEHNRYATAERIAEQAAGLVTALRCGNTAGIESATSALLEGVEAERTKARAEQHGLIKDGGHAEIRGQASQPSATQLAQLPNIKAVSVDEVLQRLVPPELPKMVSTGTVKPLVDLSQLGEPPALPQTVHTTDQAHTRLNPTLPTLRRAPLSIVAPQVNTDYKAYTLIFPVAAKDKQASRWNLTYAVTKEVLEHNGVTASPAAVEEVAARLGHLDFSAGSDGQGKLEVTYTDGTWVAAAAHKDADGKEVHGYQLTMFGEFQQAVMEHRGVAEAVTRAGTKGLSEMRMSERMQTAVGIAYDKYLLPETKQALGDITPGQLGTVLAVGGAASILAKSAGRGVLGPAGAAAGMYEVTKQYVAAAEFIKQCGEAKTQADLEKAARQVARLSAEMAADGVLGVAGGLASRVAPGVARKADELLTRGVEGIKETFTNRLGSPPVLMPAGGATIHGVAGNVEAEELGMLSKSVEEVGRAKQINDKIGVEPQERVGHEGYNARAEFRDQIHNSTWTSHGDKHLKAKTEEQAKLFSKTGEMEAQYLPGLNTKAMEKEVMWNAMRNGYFVKKPGSDTYYFYHKFERVIGYNNGKPAQWMRAELTSVKGTPTYHGHPTTIQQVRKHLPGVKE